MCRKSWAVEIVKHSNQWLPFLSKRWLYVLDSATGCSPNLHQGRKLPRRTPAGARRQGKPRQVRCYIFFCVSPAKCSRTRVCMWLGWPWPCTFSSSWTGRIWRKGWCHDSVIVQAGPLGLRDAIVWMDLACLGWSGKLGMGMTLLYLLPFFVFFFRHSFWSIDRNVIF